MGQQRYRELCQDLIRAKKQAAIAAIQQLSQERKKYIENEAEGGGSVHAHMEPVRNAVKVSYFGTHWAGFFCAHITPLMFQEFLEN